MSAVLKRAGLGVIAVAGLVALGVFVLPYWALVLWLQGVVWGWW